MRKWILTFMLGVGSAILLSGCQGESSTPENAAISPDGKYIAVVYVVSNGATSGEVRVEVSSRRLFEANVRPLDHLKICETDANNVKSENDTKVSWLDNTHVEFDGKTLSIK